MLKAVRNLPRTEREALVVAFFGHHSYRQAAVVLGEAEGTIKSRIRSGIRRLGAALADATIDEAATDRPLTRPSMTSQPIR